jgi:hypothetical protein
MYQTDIAHLDKETILSCKTPDSIRLYILTSQHYGQHYKTKKVAKIW